MRGILREKHRCAFRISFFSIFPPSEFDPFEAPSSRDNNTGGRFTLRGSHARRESVSRLRVLALTHALSTTTWLKRPQLAPSRQKNRPLTWSPTLPCHLSHRRPDRDVGETRRRGRSPCGRSAEEKKGE